MNLELNKIFNKDCLVGMQNLIDNGYINHFDFIEIDPPYNIGKDKWDKFKSHEEYLSFIKKTIELASLLMSDNGTLFIWHNDINVIADYIHIIKSNTNLVLKQQCIWNKYFKYMDNGEVNNQYGFLNGFIQSDLNRSYQKMCEYVLYYTKQDEELTLYNENDPFKEIKEYFYNAKDKANLSMNKINQKLGHRQSEHTFYTKTQWLFPTKETYEKLQQIMDLPIDYEILLEKYKNMRYAFNSNKNDYRSCIWNYQISKETKHKTEKPLQLYYDLFEIHTRKNSKCLFPFVGSGNNIVSLLELNNKDNGDRQYIGFELDQKFYDITNQRIDDIKMA